MAKFKIGKFLGFTASTLLLRDEMLNIGLIMNTVHSRYTLDALNDLKIEFEILKGRLLELRNCDTIDYLQASESLSALYSFGVDEEDENKFLKKHKKALISLYREYSKYYKGEVTKDEFSGFLSKGNYDVDISKCEGVINTVNKFRKLNNTVTFNGNVIEVNDNCVQLIGVLLKRMDILDNYLVEINNVLKSNYYANSKFMGETLYKLSKKKNINMIHNDIILPYTSKVNSVTASSRTIEDTCQVRIKACESVFQTSLDSKEVAVTENKGRSITSPETRKLLNDYKFIQPLIVKSPQLTEIILNSLKSFNQNYLCSMMHWSYDSIDFSKLLLDCDSIGIGGLTVNGVKFLEYSMKDLSFDDDTKVTVIDKYTNENLTGVLSLMYRDAQSRKMFLDEEV